MLKANHTFFVSKFIKFFSIWKTNRSFHSVNIDDFIDDKSKPMILIANHFSWWDGFWMNYLNSKRFNRKFYFMMLEDQLEKRKFLLKCGGFSVNKSSKNLIETINYTIDLLKDNSNLVLIFPQGKIQTLYTQKFEFEKGIEHILKRNKSDVQIIFSANMIDYYSYEKPSLFIYLKKYDSLDYSVDSIESSYNSFFSECIAKHKSGELV